MGLCLVFASIAFGILMKLLPTGRDADEDCGGVQCHPARTLVGGIVASRKIKTNSVLGPYIQHCELPARTTMPSSLKRKDVCTSNFIRDFISNNSVENRTYIHLPCRNQAVEKGFDLNTGYRHFASVAEEYKKKSWSKRAGGRATGEVSDGKDSDGRSKSRVSRKVKYTEKDKVKSVAANSKMDRKKVGTMESVGKVGGGSGKRKPFYDTEKPKLSVSKLKSKLRKGSQVEPVANEGSESGFWKKQKEKCERESRGKLYIAKLEPNRRDLSNVASLANEAGGRGFLKKQKKPNIDRKEKASISIDQLKRMRKKKGNVDDAVDKDGRRGLEKNMKQSYASINKRSDAYGTALDLGKKAVKERKRKHDDGEKSDDKPKKKKRVIKIDPRDVSNKRLDDRIILEGTTKEKGKGPEEKSEMSKNAQFRAIQPSPSILSFVEDNLLGRRRLIEFKRAGYNIDLSAPLDNIPFSTSTERERIEEPIFRNKLEFFAAAKISSSFPAPELPEIAFAGRSNVGKSSLLNALTRQWGVARTSDKPGLTQTINFFKLGKKLCLVDLPGYGFAYAKEEVKENWEELVKEYVSTRVGLRRVCLLIDTKWGMKPRDHELIDLMERSQTKYQIMLTKSDVVFPINVARRAMQIEENLKANKSLVQPVMMVSSKSGAGIRTLRTVLAPIARFAKL